jgi:hypothetical protein
MGDNGIRRLRWQWVTTEDDDVNGATGHEVDDGNKERRQLWQRAMMTT